MSYNNLRPRVEKAISLLERGAVTPEKVRFVPYTVRGDTGKEYQVRFYPETNEWTCECPDHRERHQTCKHIWACIMYREAD